MSMVERVDAALSEANLPALDQATAELARLAAVEIDDGEPLNRYGPLLLRTLDALMLTPKSRIGAGTNAPTGSTDDKPKPGPVDELARLRGRRDTRTDRAAATDATAT